MAVVLENLVSSRRVFVSRFVVQMFFVALLVSTFVQSSFAAKAGSAAQGDSQKPRPMIAAWFRRMISDGEMRVPVYKSSLDSEPTQVESGDIVVTSDDVRQRFWFSHNPLDIRRSLILTGLEMQLGNLYRSPGMAGIKFRNYADREFPEDSSMRLMSNKKTRFRYRMASIASEMMEGGQFSRDGSYFVFDQNPTLKKVSPIFGR